jgi:AraC-like DNA-binding protein
LSHPQLQVRSEEQIAQTGLDHILVWFYERGGVEGRFHRNHVKVEAGDIVLVDMAKPFETSIASSTILALMLPRARLPVALRNRDLHGILLNREIEATRLLAAHIRAFVRASRGLTVRQGLLAAEALVCLVQGALTPGGIMAETAETADATLLGRVQIHVEANLHKPELSVTEIAQALGMSRSTLYRLFEPMGGAAAYIRERRLLRAYEIIHSDLNPDLTLTSISFAQGFASEAYFSRAFKQRFGISPRAARKGAQNRRRAGDSIPPPPLTPGVQPLSFTAGKG